MCCVWHDAINTWTNTLSEEEEKNLSAEKELQKNAMKKKKLKKSAAEESCICVSVSQCLYDIFSKQLCKYSNYGNRRKTCVHVAPMPKETRVSVLFSFFCIACLYLPWIRLSTPHQMHWQLSPSLYVAYTHTLTHAPSYKHIDWIIETENKSIHYPQPV